MSQFPTIIPTFTDFDGNQTLAQNNHAARHNKVHEELAALATKVGTNSSADPNSLDKKTETLRNDVTALQASISPLLVDPTTKAYVDTAISTAVAAAKQALYPIGSYYINETDGTNPGALLGFGTWSQVKDTFILAVGDTYAANTTGGASTVTLTTAQIPAHQHSMGHVNHSAGPGPANPSVDWAGYLHPSWSGKNGLPDYVDNGDVAYPSTGPRGGGGAHNNMPPYKTAYVWKRTA